MKSEKFAFRLASCVMSFSFGLAMAMLPTHVLAAEDVVIGVLVPTTGAIAPLGIDMRNGYELAVKDAPNVKGSTVILVIEDSHANPATGLKKAQKLVIQDKA